MKRIYLDYAASTPVDPRVLAAMQPYFSEKSGNPGSLHSFGQEAIAAVDASRESIARSIGAGFREIIFTGSATEANNLALRGVVARFREGADERPRIIISSVEHESVLETAHDLEREGVEVVYLPVNNAGIVDLKKLKENLTANTVLVSVIYAQNEVGTVEPIAEMAKMVREARGAGTYPLLHTDAAQAFQFLDCDVKALGVDLMTLSAHKIYGPKGIGALYIRSDKNLTSLIAPIISGGGQEFGLRSGTENVPSIVEFTKAVELAVEVRQQETKRIQELRNQFLAGLKKIFPDLEINGAAINGMETNEIETSVAGENLKNLPNILNVYFPGREAQTLLTKLDLAGLAVSSGSACRSRALTASYVIEALGYSKNRAKSSIRFSFGRGTKIGRASCRERV